MKHLFPGLELGRSTRDALDEALRETGVDADLVTLDPDDAGALARACDQPGAHVIVPADAARETGALVTAEEGWIDGGLGSAVAELLDPRHPVPVEHIGLDEGDATPGGADALLAHGLTAAHIMGAAHDAMERKASPRGDGTR